MSESTTTDFSKFGSREREMAEELLRASRLQGFPEDFDISDVTEVGVSIMLNMNSGYVFFTNADCQVAMMNGDELESFYSCPICGHEGFAEEMEHNTDDPECQEYLSDIGVVKA
jgi:hypothetical protein